MEVRKTLSFKDYLAGAVLANSLAWLVLGIAPFFDANSLTLVRLLFLAYVSGAVIAGYLIARKALQNHMKIGLKVGLGAFIFHIYAFMGIIELITGERMLNLLDHLLILAIFIAGGVVGALLCQRLHQEK